MLVLAPVQPVAGLECRLLPTMRGHLSKNDLFKGRHVNKRSSFCACAGICDTSSYRDLAEMIAERGLSISYTISLR